MKIINDVTIYKGIADLKVEIIDFDKTAIQYKVANTPICQFDQHSRARVGVKFIDYKVSEAPEYVLYTDLYEKLINNSDALSKFIECALELEALRQYAKIKDDYNLMSRSCSYTVIQDYKSLAGQMNRRLKFCEEEFIVGLHWLLRDQMIFNNIQIAKDFKPGCDISCECDYSSADYLSNAFGCLFQGCNRWPFHAEFTSFNKSCTTPDLIEQQLGISVFKSEYEIKNSVR